MTTTRPIRIFLDMPDYSTLVATIKQTLPSVGDEPTHVYVESAEGADIICDIEFVRTAGLEGLTGKLNEAREGSPLSITLGQALEVEDHFH